MESLRSLTFILLICFASIFFFFLGSCSSLDLDLDLDHIHRYDDFVECLIDKFQLSNIATDTIYTPENATYASLLSAQNLRLASSSPETRPDLIMTPFHVSEIQAAIYCSRKVGVLIRVRSGGHDFEGLSYTSGGLTLTPFVIVDMRKFRSVTVDVEEKTAWAQVGATLGQLYYTINRNSKTLGFPAGMCPTVGVGGHLSGGGYSMMSRKHSLASDHIIDARLINADGRILDRRSMGEDLFWAIRGGGGSSFGIVLEFKVSLVAVPEMITVSMVTRTLEQNATELVHKWQYIADKVDENLMIRLSIYPDNSPTTGNPTIAVLFMIQYMGVGGTRDLVPIMQDHFPELGFIEQDCIQMSWIESLLFFWTSGSSNQTIESLLDPIPTEGGKYALAYYKGKSDFVSAPISLDGLREIWKFLLEQQGSSLQFSPYGGVMNTFPESETPFPHRRGNIFMIFYCVAWSSADESQPTMDWIRRLYSYMARHVTKNPRAAYFNYRDLDIGRNNEGNTSYSEASVWGLSYFKNNFRRLVRVKTKFDPSNFFRNEQSIPPLVSIDEVIRNDEIDG